MFKSDRKPDEQARLWPENVVEPERYRLNAKKNNARAYRHFVGKDPRVMRSSAAGRAVRLFVRRIRAFIDRPALQRRLMEFCEHIPHRAKIQALRHYMIPRGRLRRQERGKAQKVA